MGYLESFLIYFVTFGISILFCSLYEFLYKKNNYNELPLLIKTGLLIFVMLPPVFISTIRYGLGTDYFRYVLMYENIAYGQFEYTWKMYGNEPLSFAINKLAFVFFDSEIGMFFISALIINLFLILGLDYFKKNISMSMGLFIFYMFLFNFGLNGVRQAMAMSIVFFAFRFLIEKRILSYMLFIIVATLFHNSAIIALIFYLFTIKRKRFINKTYNFVYYLGILLTPILLVALIDLAATLPIVENYAKYIGDLSFSFNIGFLLRVLPILLPIIIFKKSIVSINKSYETIINISLLNIPFQYLVYYTEWGHRLALYTNFTYVILVPLLIKSMRKQEYKAITWFYYVFLFLTIYISDYLINNYQEVYPFRSIFGF